MKYVQQLLKKKGNDVWTISQDAPVFDALQLMAQKNVGALIVVDQKKVVGIFSERDYARKSLDFDDSPRITPVREIMVSRVIYVTSDNTVEECMALFTQKRVRHLPVMDNQELVGIISIGDVVKNLIAEKDFLIEQLEHYIAASGR
ncbi:MAG: CBS domain-containing protein [Planctomycetes bacterium]|nr:CBS domain-containing protein [Planctomycetota bacterium]